MKRTELEAKFAETFFVQVPTHRLPWASFADGRRDCSDESAPPVRLLRLQLRCGGCSPPGGATAAAGSEPNDADDGDDDDEGGLF